MKCKINRKIGAGNTKTISSLTYRFPLSLIRGAFVYRAVVIDDDDDVTTMIAAHEKSGNVAFELYVELEDVEKGCRDVNVPASNPEIQPIRQCEAEIPSSSQVATEAAIDLNIVPFGESYVFEEYENEDEDEEDRDSDVEIIPAPGPHLSLSIGSSRDPPAYQPPSHMRCIDIDAMQAHEFPEYAHTIPSLMTYSETGDLCIGMRFPTKDAVLSAIKHYNIKQSVDYKVLVTTPTKYVGKCIMFGQGCNWSIRAAFMKRNQIREVRKYNGPRTCRVERISQDHTKLDSNVIRDFIVPLVKENLPISVLDLIVEIRTRYGYCVSYRKAWNGKQKAIAELYGDWDKSYNDLPNLLAAMQQICSGSCIEGFRYCKPIVQVDGTFLYGKCKETLLLAISQDGNRNILPLAFAIVEGETKEAWAFFLTNLRKHVKQMGICLISNRNESIKSVIRSKGIRWAPPYAYPVYCLRHVAVNFMKEFNDNELRREIVSMGNELTSTRFHQRLENVRKKNSRAGKWLDNISKERWTLSYVGGRRYGHMTTNLAEFINPMFKGTRHLRIAALVHESYCMLAQLFVEMGKKQLRMMDSGQIYCELVTQDLQEHCSKAKSHRVHDFSHANEFWVEESVQSSEGSPLKSYTVNLTQRWCGCGKFQACRYPCSHVFAVCSHIHVDYNEYVDNVYKLTTIFKVYKHEIEALPNEMYWTKHTGPEFYPNPKLRRDPISRPQSTRIHKEIDIREPGQPKHCGLCRNKGHSRQTCPYTAGTLGGATN
ncbi:hypothetical protein J1N35_009372 [Gossypium stocksii]|uniref:SWIM-type domain-containing protein n=1 Tax=Gossypium stocksii TaxID=47602 RepID=A0A9D3VYC0_9ROSI|nr:hypothetical protein J1N35_009372 [Gossypium stocksii]